MSAAALPVFVRLDGPAVTLIDATAGQVTAVTYWGPRLGAVDPATLALLGARGEAPVSPATEIPLALTPQAGIGSPGRPGLAAHRDGQGWASNAKLVRVEARADRHGTTRDGLAADLNTVGFAAMARGDDAIAETYFNRALALRSMSPGRTCATSSCAPAAAISMPMPIPTRGATDMTIELFTIVLALIALGCVLAGAVADVIRFEIPDTLSVVLLATALGYGALTPGFDWLSHLAGPAVMFAAGLLIFRFGIMGDGDVELLIGSAAWTGLGGLPLQLVGIALVGGVLAAVLIVARRAAPRFASAGALPRVFHQDAPLPYAVAIAAGTCWWALAAWPVM